MLRFAILDSNNNIIKVNMDDYKNWLKKNESKKIIKRTFINNKILISTVFLGIDHSSYIYKNKPTKPLWFETMVFDHNIPPKLKEYMLRYETHERALRGHKTMERFVRWQLDKK